jgi:hypothetical protein
MWRIVRGLPGSEQGENAQGSERAAAAGARQLSQSFAAEAAVNSDSDADLGGSSVCGANVKATRKRDKDDRSYQPSGQKKKKQWPSGAELAEGLDDDLPAFSQLSKRAVKRKAVLDDSDDDDGCELQDGAGVRTTDAMRENTAQAAEKRKRCGLRVRCSACSSWLPVAAQRTCACPRRLYAAWAPQH